MESFKINIYQESQESEVLVIPDDCTDQSIFHLVMNGQETCKLKYTEPGKWTIIDGQELSLGDLEAITHKIENQYF